MCPLTLPPIARESHAPAWPPSRAEQPPLSTLFTPSEGLASVKPEKTPSWEEDEELARRLITRDRQAFDTFYQRYAPVLLRRLYRMTGDRQQAQEFLQEVMIEVIESLQNYRGTGALGAWINRIATFIMIDHFRQKQRHAGFWERWSNQLASLHERPTPLPQQVMESDEMRELVRAQLEYLSPRKRMAILLCDLEGLSLEEASEQMAIPAGTVSSRLHHGRRELKQRIKNELKRRGLAVEDALRQ